MMFFEKIRGLWQKEPPIVRLFVAQGPAQLLMCEAVARHLAKVSPRRRAVNVCLLFGKYTFGEKSGISSATRMLARAEIWNRVVDCYDLEDQLWQNAEADFAETIETIRRYVGIADFHELHLGRNWGLTNELVCAAFPEAEVCVCGDVVGKIGSVRLKSFAPVRRTYAVLPDFQILFDEESSVTPNNAELSIVAKSHYQKAVECAAAKMPVDPKVASQVEKATLLLTSTYADAGFLSFEDEIRMVVELTKPHLHNVEWVYVKPHPRETAGQAAEVVRRLNELNFGGKACLFFDHEGADATIRFLPLEVVLKRYQFRDVLTPVGSYASVLTPWLCDIDVHLPSVDEVTAVFGRDPAEAPRFFELFEELWGYRRNLETWDGKSVLWSRHIQNTGAYLHLKTRDREKRWRAELQFTGSALIEAAERGKNQTRAEVSPPRNSSAVAP